MTAVMGSRAAEVLTKAITCSSKASERSWAETASDIAAISGEHGRMVCFITVLLAITYCGSPFFLEVIILKKKLVSVWWSEAV